MKVLFDTSVLVAAVVQSHAAHARALPWLVRARGDSIAMCVAAHTLAELYAVLTRLPVSPRIAPATARLLVRENVEKVGSVSALSAAEYAAALGRFAELGIAGGGVYDGLIAQVAIKVRADRLLTLNPDDFLRVWPEGADRITTP